MRYWYFTLTRKHAATAGLGYDSGYIAVHAAGETEARDKIWDRCGAGWSFQYDSVEKIHELDRKLLETIP